MAARLRERLIEGRKIRVAEKGRPLVEPDGSGFVPLAEFFGAEHRITSENILACFGWRDTGYDTVEIRATPAVRTGNRVLDKTLLERLNKQLKFIRQRVKKMEAKRVELKDEHDSFSAKARSDLDTKTRNKYRAQIRRRREAIDKEITGSKSSVARLMNQIKQANKPENFVDEVVPEKREQVRVPGDTFIEWANSRERKGDQLRPHQYEELSPSKPKGFGGLENHIIREAIRYGVFCPLPEAWLEDTKLPFGQIDESKLIAVCKQLSERPGLRQIPADGVTIIRYALRHRGERGETNQDDMENALILKTGGAQIGGQVYSGRRTDAGSKLESFDTTRAGGSDTPSGGTGDDDQWSGVDSDGDK